MQECVYIVRTPRGQILGAFDGKDAVEASASLGDLRVVWESAFAGALIQRYAEDTFASIELVPLYYKGVELS